MSRLLDVHNFIAEKLRWQQQVLHDPRLSPTAKVIGCQLMHDLNVSKRGAWRSQADCAKLLNINVRTVRRCMAELVAGGHLLTTPSAGRGHAILYEALLKAGIMPAIPDEKAGNLSAFSATEKRANRARKADTGARPFLYETITPPSPPIAGDSGDAAGLAGTARTACAVPDDIRRMAADAPGLGEAWARTWLDTAGWDPDTRTLTPLGATARQRIHWCLGRELAAAGVSLAEPPAAGRRAG
jgi:hypothetical protein